MKSIELRKPISTARQRRVITNPFKLLLDKYIAFAESKKDERVYWFMKAIIGIPCVIMVPAISAMYLMGINHIWFVGFCMLMFFANIMLHISDVKSKFYIPFYHVTISLMIAIPLISYLVSL